MFGLGIFLGNHGSLLTNKFYFSVEDDLAEHSIRTFFTAFGAIRSIVCVHQSRCAFVNFQTRAGAEAAAESCRGRAVIAGCPLKIMWGKPRPLGNVDKAHAASIGRQKHSAGGGPSPRTQEGNATDEGTGPSDSGNNDLLPLPPPGSADAISYTSQTPL